MTVISAILAALAVLLLVVWFGRRVSQPWSVAFAPAVAVAVFQLWKLAVEAGAEAAAAGLAAVASLILALAIRRGREMTG